MKSVRLNLLTMSKKYKNALYVILNPFVSLRTRSVKNLINSIAYKFQILRPPPGRGTQNDIFQETQQVRGSLTLTPTPRLAELGKHAKRYPRSNKNCLVR